MDYLGVHSVCQMPFIWTKSASEIPKNVARTEHALVSL
jgi:hypothetical protein